MDKFVEYKVVHTFAGGDKHYNAVVQFENTADCEDCIGSATSDQMDIIIHMTQDVEWGEIFFISLSQDFLIWIDC